MGEKCFDLAHPETTEFLMFSNGLVDFFGFVWVLVVFFWFGSVWGFI